MSQDTEKTEKTAKIRSIRVVENTEYFRTTAEAADQLGLTEKTLETWRCRGTGPRYVKIGGGRAVRYPQSYLDEYKEAMKAA